MRDDLSILLGDLDFHLIFRWEERNILNNRVMGPAFNHMSAEDGRSGAPFYKPAKLVVGRIVRSQGADGFLAVVHAVEGSKDVSVLINPLINVGRGGRSVGDRRIRFFPGVMKIGKGLLGKVIGS